MECIAVDNITKDDYIYIHFDGKLFNGNDYPFEQAYLSLKRIQK